MDAEPAIVIDSREQLLYTLTEAAEIEHNLMCCYLYAAWSLKTEDDDDVAPEMRAELRRWQRAIIDVAIDEMTHLALVGNLMTALGGVAHFNRPNFPIGPGYHPAELKVRLAPFNRATLQHFVHLERPEGSDEPDGEGFVSTVAYARGLNGLRLAPSAQDYLTVGHLYRSVEAGLRHLAATFGEAALFCGDRALQVGPDIVSLTGLGAVTDLASACAAVETIVEQGEGAQTDTAEGHYQRFVAVRAAFDTLAAASPGFAPAFPAATNPVMRRPPDPQGRVWIADPAAQSVLDLANATYHLMLMALAHGFTALDPEQKRTFINLAIDLMQAVAPLGKELARMKANDTDGCNAGISFAAPRALASPPVTVDVLPTLAFRVKTLAEAAERLGPSPRVAQAVNALHRIHASIAGAAVTTTATAVTPPSPAPAGPAPQAAVAPDPGADAGPEVVEGTDLTLIVDGKRCIHARFCVTGAPKTFIANVKGPWLHPDATDTTLLVEVAHACPSGAVAYRRKDGKPDETAPSVNMLRLRENGPYAIHAPLQIAGKDEGFRATLCRCGASKNKPYCDGSHHEIEFMATGEPATISLDPLASRDGALRIDPQQNGPLKVSGNLEICAGTGRVVQRVTEARLCRCGHSAKKPFCDGSHRAAGFVAPGA